ncbi:MAG: hypothetical protein M1817_004111 [Caeruleum heppii]|nr:MAG: hypothetical protein M1817_004111 [Caeruleum heppii]
MQLSLGSRSPSQLLLLGLLSASVAQAQRPFVVNPIRNESDSEIIAFEVKRGPSPPVEQAKRSLDTRAERVNTTETANSTDADLDFLGANVSDVYEWPPPTTTVRIPNTAFSLVYSRIAINDTDELEELWSTPVNTTRMTKLLGSAVQQAQQSAVAPEYARVSGVIYEPDYPGQYRANELPGSHMHLNARSYRVNSYDSVRYNFTLARSYAGNMTWTQYGNITQFLLEMATNETTKATEGGTQPQEWTLGIAGRISGKDGLTGRERPWANVLINACYWENCTCLEGIC